MKRIIHQYPILDGEQLNKLGIQEEMLEIEYIQDDKVYKEKVVIDSKRTLLLSNYDHWDPDSVDVKIRGAFHLLSPRHLYSEQGVLPEKAAMGIATEFLSPLSGQRKIFQEKLYSSYSINERMKVEYSITLPRGTYRGYGELVHYLYIAKKSPTYKGRRANSDGLVLGNLLSPIRVIFDGSGSLFPVVLADLGASGPLWNQYFYSFNPEVDSFTEDNVSLVINSNHKRFKDLNISDFKTPNTLRNEIFSSWVHLLFTIISQDHQETFDKITRGDVEGFETGSIAHWLFYFSTSFEINLSNIKEMHSSINKAVHKMLG